MARRTYHVAPSGRDWKVKAEGADRAYGVYENKADAVDHARELARAAGKGQIVIHGRHGRIQTEHTYGSDPYPPKG